MATWHHYSNPNMNNKVCCGNCIHIYDENNMTVCMLHDWMGTTFDYCCDSFNNGEE